MKNNIQLRWSDAWLLQSIYYAKNDTPTGARFPAIIGAADFIEHAIMNYEELASGLSRLEEVGLVHVTDDLSCVTCTPNALAIIEPIVKRHREVLKVKELIEKEINATRWSPCEKVPSPHNNLQFRGMTRDLYMTAVNEYLRLAKSALKKLR